MRQFLVTREEVKQMVKEAIDDYIRNSPSAQKVLKGEPDAETIQQVH